MDITKYKKEIGFGLVVIAVICIVVAAFKMEKDDTGEESPTESVFIEVPDGDVTEVSDSKSHAYTTHTGKTNIELIWENGDSDKETPEKDEKVSPKGSNGPKRASQEDLFGQQTQPVRQSPTPKSSSNPYRETPAEREARHQRRHEEALELAERIQDGQQPQSKVDEGFQENVTIPLPDSKVKRSDVISSLDGWEGDGGFSSLDDSGIKPEEDPYTPFRCMFARESKLTDGQRVTVILLDDLTVSGISVPRNTHLMATCQISNRLELEFNNIEIGGRILALGFEAYDIDGSKGIYCPDAGSAGKTAKNRGADILSSALSSRLGRVARDVATTGISLVQSADGQRTVSVPAGYTFFIIKKRLN